MTLTTEDPGAVANAVPGVVAGVSHLGDVLQYVVRCADERELLCRQPRDRAHRLEPGDDVWCTWAPDDVRLFSANQTALVLVDPAAE